jgi:hypothetical protein
MMMEGKQRRECASEFGALLSSQITSEIELLDFLLWHNVVIRYPFI